MQDTKLTIENRSLFYKSFYFFNKITSNHGNDWLLALTWILVFELFSSVLEYKYLDVAQNYIYHIPESFFKEILIAFLIVGFIWYCVYSVVFMKRNNFFFLAFYLSLGAYLVLTHDVTFSLLAHNLVNPFELEFNGFGFYIIFQLFIKLIITYLIYQFFVSLKRSKKAYL